MTDEKRFGDEEEELLLKALRGQELSPYFRKPEGGEMVQTLEKEFAAYVGSEYAVAVTNGTSALQVAYLACGLGPQSRVVVPSHSFIATASMVLAVGATPVWADVREDTYCIDEKTFLPARVVSAIVPVDLLGHPSEAKAIWENAHPKGVKVIQDAAQAIGSELPGGGMVGGNFCDCATWSLQSTKSLSSGEGGMITTNDARIYEKAKLLRNHGSQYGNADFLTFNFRMNELNAAVGLAQLRKYPKLLEKQRTNAEYLLANLPDGINPPKPKGKPNQYIVGCTVEPGFNRTRFLGEVIRRGLSKGMPGSVISLGYTMPLYKKPLFNDCRPWSTMTVAEGLCQKWVWFDIHRWISLSTMMERVQAIREVARSCW